MKEEILKLRGEGLSYSEISKVVGCSKSTVSYHCGEGQKQKSLIRQRRKRGTVKGILKNKIDNFRNRKLSSKVRDFQRERTRKGSWKGSGKNTNVFKEEELLHKITSHPKCYLTGDDIDLTNPSSYSFDHIIPLYEGGTSDLSNLGLTTRDANMAKNKLTVNMFIELCKKVVINNGYSIRKT